MAKRISFFIGSMHGGGAERVISIIANHYCQMGWNVDIALLFDKDIGYDLDARINIIDLAQAQGSYYKRLPKWLLGIRRYVKKTKPDRIVSFVGRINVLVLTACLGLKVPIIVSERNDPKHDGRSNLMLKICNWSYKRAKAVVYQTKYEQSCFSNKLNNGVVIANPVTIAVEPEKTTRPFEIVTAGRLLPQKNQALLIDAVAQIKERYPAVKLTRISGAALFHIRHKCVKSRAPGHFQQFTFSVADTVAQGAEHPRFRIVKSDGADAGNPLPQIHTQPGTILCLPCRQAKLLFSILPANGQLHLGAAAIQRSPDILRAGHRLMIDGQNFVADLQPRRPGLGAQILVIGHHRHAAAAQLQSYNFPHRDQLFRRPGLHGQHTKQHRRNGAGNHSLHIRPSFFSALLIWSAAEKCNR